MTNGNGVSTHPSLLVQLRGPDNNEKAWRAFLERYQPMIYDWCRRAGLTHDSAEEVSATVLAKLVRALRSFVYDPKHCFRGWLKTVVTNEVCSFWRYWKRHPEPRRIDDSHIRKRLEEDLRRLAHEVSGALEDDLRKAAVVVQRVRERIEDRTWQIFVRTALQDEPAPEVANDLKIAVAAVYEAKRRVGRMLRQEGENVQGQAEH